jgi:hypothetical protein
VEEENFGGAMMHVIEARRWCVAAALFFLAASLWAASGSLSGTLKDATGAVVPGARLTLLNTALKTEYTTTSDGQGVYSFPNLPVGRYELTIEAPGFRSQKKTDMMMDTDAAIRVDAALVVAQQTEEVTVTASTAAIDTQVDTVATHLGEVVSASQIAAIPLNGRSYTDLLAIQPGVSPITTLTATSVIMAGVTGTINPSGDANPGNVSISGQRESSNGFMVNATDVQEHMNGGTSVIPNLDSIEEFRVLTNNFDPEYGNYNGGMINVITKSGSNAFHGDIFEFLRNTDLDAKNFFDSRRGAFQQNQFGGTVGGPIKKDKVFFFADYQGTRTVQGITSPTTTVPSLADRTGNLSDVASALTGIVGGPNTVKWLEQQLGYPVFTGERYYTPGCTSSAQCVLPNATIPTSAWSAPAQHLLQYIPRPDIGSNLFSSSAYPQRVRDDKAAFRLDGNTRWGQLSGYYFVDNYWLDNPYPGQQGGASVPGFDALTIGQAQLLTVGDTKILSPTMINEFHVGFVRNVNNIGAPNGGLGVTLASQGFQTGGGAGIVVQDPKIEGVMNIVFPSFVMGVPITNTFQWNNTLYAGDAVSKVLGSHTLKFGGQFHNDQVNESPNATFNGTFSILGTETGSAFADFLLGFPSNFTQTTGQRFYLRNRYFGAFVQDSWRARSNLTINVGLRWDLIAPWNEKYNNIQTVVPGEQSVLYPNAIPGLVVPGDPGIPAGLSPTHYHNFAPRLGLAYSPNPHGKFLKALLGDGGKSSIRASYGIFYTEFPGLSAGIMYGVAPFGYNYLSPAPPEFARPFINSGDGAQNTNPYPFTFPPHNVSQSNPYTAFNFAAVTPDSADPYFYYKNTVPYSESYMFSIQREIRSNTLVTVSYAGNQGHHILVLVPTNPGNAALCLSLSKPNQVAPGSATCGPFGENGTYTSAAGQVYNETRMGLGPDYGAVTAQQTIGNSNYNSLQTTVRMALGKRATLLLGYTYSKSIDDASNLGEQLDPFNYRATRVLSSWDMTHNFVATYTYKLPFDRYFGRNRLTEGWSLSGTTRLSTGFPVTLWDNSDNSLLGTLGNGVNNQLLDTPRIVGGNLQINNDPRSGQPAFNPNYFATETLGVLGDAPRRFFHGPGIENFDVQLSKNVRLTESTSLDFRVEAFNVFNHAQFYGPSSVNGEVNDPNFGHVVSAAAPRLLQVAMKFYF